MPKRTRRERSRLPSHHYRHRRNSCDRSQSSSRRSNSLNAKKALLLEEELADMRRQLKVLQRQALQKATSPAMSMNTDGNRHLSGVFNEVGADVLDVPRKYLLRLNFVIVLAMQRPLEMR